MKAQRTAIAKESLDSTVGYELTPWEREIIEAAHRGLDKLRADYNRKHPNAPINPAKNTRQ